MNEELDVFIDQFYGKYSPNDIPSGDRRTRLKEKLRADFDGYVSQMYSKYSPDNVPDPTRLASLKSKYLVAQQQTVAEQPTLFGHIKDIVKDYDVPVEAKPTPIQNAIKRGSNLADQAAILSPFNTPEGEQINELANLQKQNFPASEAYQAFNQSKTAGEALTNLVQSPIQIISELTAESMTSLLKYGGPRMAAGAGVGAGLGSVLPGIGTATGTGAGVAVGMADASLGLEYSSAFIESLKEAGIDVTNPEALKTAFEDDNIVSEARSHALKKGVPIALFDLISGGIAGKIVTKPAKSIITKIGKGAAEFGVQSALGGAGEATGQLVAGEELNPSAIIAEMIGELGTTPIEVANAALTFNRNLAQADQIIDEVADTGDPALNAEIDAAAQVDPVDKQVLEEKKLAEVAIEHQKEVERLEKLEESNRDSRIENAENTKTNTAESTEKEVKPSETPEYKVAVEQVRRLQERFAQMPENASDEETNALYIELVQARQTLQKIAGKPKDSRKKTDIQKQIEDTTGVTKPEKSVKMTPNEAIKQQVQTFFRGMDKGVRKGKELTNELVTKVQEAIKDSPLQPKQINSILTRVRNTNLFTPGSISRLNTFIDRVTQDAEYADKLSEAKALNKKLRKLSKSSSSNLQNYKIIAKAFASINPEDTFINPHLEWGNKILSALTSPAKPGYAPVDVAAAQEYITDLQEKVAEYEEESVLVEEGSEKIPSPVFETLRTSLDALKDKDLSEFDEREVRAINSLKTVDPDTYNKTDEKAIKEASTLVRVIDNIVENDDFSNVGSVEPIIKARENLKKAAKLVEDVNIKSIRSVGKYGANLYQQFARIFGESGLASDIQNLLGITDLWSAGSRVEGKEIQYSEQIEKKVKEIKKKYKVDVRELPNSVRLVAYGQLAMNYGDDADIAKVKDNIRRSAVEHTKADEVLGKEWTKVYDEVKDINTVQEANDLLKKKYPGLYEILKFNTNKFTSEVNEELGRTRTEIHNEPYISANNYSHIEFDNISNTTDEQESFVEGATPVRAKVKQRASTTGIKATRSMRQGNAYNSYWIESQLKGYRKSLYDIEASPAKALVAQTIYSAQFDEIVGGKDNGDLIRKMVFSADQIQQGISKATANDAVKFLNRITQFLRNIGAIRALASVSQIAKQPTVLVKTFVNHVGSGSVDSFFKGLGAINLISTSPNLKKLFDHYTVGVRGQRLGGIERGDSIGYRMSTSSTRGLVRGAEWLRGKSDKFTQTSLTPLTKADVYAARTTWLSYYLQRLKELGVKDVNLNTEFEKQNDPVRKRAAAFAEQMIAETQSPSNPATLAQVVRNENDGGWNFVKNILIPFSTFAITAKYRNILDVGKFIRNPSKRNASAVAGNVFEMAVYSSIAYLVLPMWKDLLKGVFEDLFGVESGEEDDDKKWEMRMKSFYTNLTNAAIPFAISQGGEYGTAKMANGLAYLAQDPGMSYTDWYNETRGFVWEPQEFDAGVFALGLEPYVEGVSGLISLATGTDTYEAFGRKVEVELTDKQKSILGLKTLLEMLGTVGLSENDIYNQIAKIYKEQLKLSRSSSKGTPVGRAPRPRPRPRIPARNLRP